MTGYDIMIYSHVVKNKIWMAVSLTHRRHVFLHRRSYITSFIRTTLKASIGYAICHFAEIKPTDIVCDPMCGAGTIPLGFNFNYLFFKFFIHIHIRRSILSL